MTGKHKNKPYNSILNQPGDVLLSDYVPRNGENKSDKPADDDELTGEKGGVSQAETDEELIEDDPEDDDLILNKKHDDDKLSIIDEED